ncbi:MAG TPA: ATP-binding protein [Candidatus Eisenbacteria bacterium]
MSLRLRIYLVAVGLTAAILLGLYIPLDLDRRWIHYLLWTLICLLSETLWLTAISGEGTVSAASTANLAALVLWGQSASMWIVSASTLLANVFVQRKPWERALFNAAQIAIAMWAAGTAMIGLGGPVGGLEAGGRVGLGSAGPNLAAPFLGLIGAYMLVNRALVAVAVAWSTGRSYLRVLREDWFYRERLFDDMALFLLSPLVVISYGAIGYPGVLLFYAPLRITHESQRRFAELRNAQNLLIHSERMAAKGEMAAEIGHELRNQLVAISGRAQMLLRDAERQVFAHVSRHAQIILEQSKRVETMSKGLMEFSSAELKIQRVDVNALVQRSVEFVRPQNRFDGIEWDLRLTGHVPDLQADPGQLQQVFLNLFMNAADAMAENGTPRKAITVTSDFDDRSRRLRLEVTDTGPGIPAQVLPKVFDPKFTTRPEGHGFGLSTSYRIIANHGGSIIADSPPGRGACFTITLPVDGPGAWS